MGSEPVGTWINGVIMTVFNMGSQAGRTVKAYEDKTVELIKKLEDKDEQLEERYKIILDLRAELSFKDSK